MTLRCAFPLSTDHLIPLVHFNVLRAIIRNTLILRHSSVKDLWSCDETIMALHLRAAVPPSLEPTVLQQRVPHPPWMDLFPLPSARDALIRANGMFDDCELCFDMVGTLSYGHHVRCGRSINDTERGRHGSGVDVDIDPDDMLNCLIVWGDPLYAASWEVTEGFARKWGWMLAEGCEDLLRATNSWRRLRDEEPLEWERLLRVSGVD